VPNKPVIAVEQFPELKPLGENWETIRDEAVRLFDEGFIRAAAKNNDWGLYSFFKSGALLPEMILGLIVLSALR
jgi:beta-hydroxylase